MTSASVGVTIGGRPALTVAQAAEIWGLKPGSLRSALVRGGYEPDAYIDARTPIYDRTRLAQFMLTRPGPGRRTDS